MFNQPHKYKLNHWNKELSRKSANWKASISVLHKGINSRVLEAESMKSITFICPCNMQSHSVYEVCASSRNILISPIPPTYFSLMHSLFFVHQLHLILNHPPMQGSTHNDQQIYPWAVTESRECSGWIHVIILKFQVRIAGTERCCITV